MILENLLFPVRCPACELTAQSFCDLCRAEIQPWEPLACSRCEAAGRDECLCDHLPDRVRFVTALWAFDGPVPDVIEAAKYQSQLWRFEALRSEVLGWLGAVASRLPPQTSIVPVPPSRRRFRRRGFDLAVMMARWAARNSHGRCRLRVLSRRRAVPAQASLDRAARREAVRGAFVARAVEGPVLLVDDVLTTGATVCACARALCDAGAETVAIAALARTPKFF